MKKRMIPGTDPEGSALIAVLMMMLALFFLSSIVMDTTSSYLNQWVTPQVRTSRALYVAEGGAHVALQWLRDSYGLPRNSSCSPSPCFSSTTAGQIVYNNQPVVLSASTDPDLNHPDSYTDMEGTVRSGVIAGFQSNLTNQSLGSGTFNVEATLLGTNPQRWRIASNGTVSSVSKTVTVQTRQNPFNPPYALVTGGDLAIGGNSKVQGSCGNAHSNANLSVGNSITVAGTATSTGSCSGCSGHPDWGDGRPKAKIPAVIPSDFQQYAIYELRSDGKIYYGQASATPGVEITSGPLKDQWSYSSATEVWKLSGTTAADGAFYAEGKIEVSGSPGDATTPWQATLIATGDIKISGSPRLTQYTQNLLMVAGQDLTISGDPQTDPVGGVMAAKNQLKISGNPQLNGFVFSKSAEISSVTIGNPTITYNCQLGSNPFPGDLAMVSWMEN